MAGPKQTTALKSESRILTDAPNNLWYRINTLVFDMRHFKDSNRAESRDRLNSVGDSMYIGAPYFTDEEAKQIKKTALDGKTLQKVIQDTMAEKLKRRKEGDYDVCTGHDLAPIFEKAFDINHKALDQSKHFNNLLKNYGLELKDNKRFKGV